MTSTTENWHRVVTLSQGIAMVITDIHGNWQLYQYYRDIFLDGYKAGNIQYIIFAGDLIHRDSPLDEDKSLEILLDILRLRQIYPNAVICLCGNHEMAHIYNTVLSRGKFNYTARFEIQMGYHRATIVDFFSRLPFFVRTSAGISITHAGAAPLFESLQNSYLIFSFDHQHVFEQVDRVMIGKNLRILQEGMARATGISYQTQVEAYLAIEGPENPRYNDLLRGYIAATSVSHYRLLWEVLFTRCEQEQGRRYKQSVHYLLDALSTDYHQQKFLVAGHIDVKKGYKVIAKQHLRMASGKHALPPTTARYLLIDTASPIKSMRQLTACLQKTQYS